MFSVLFPSSSLLLLCITNAAIPPPTNATAATPTAIFTLSAAIPVFATAPTALAVSVAPTAVDTPAVAF